MRGVLIMIASFVAQQAGAQQTACSDPLPLHDYSQVGYRQGEVPIPYHQREVTWQFDSGRYVVNKMILLPDSNVLRGAGRDQTVLYFPNGLKGLGQPCGNAGVDCYDWKNGVIRAEGSEIGIEDLTIEFPPHEWIHYHGEENGGFNGISLRGCTNCWVKNVTIRNADSGLFIEGGANNTVDGLHVYGQDSVRAHLHIAISTHTHDNLVTDFRVYGASHHGLTGNWGARSNVFANGWGENVRIEPDHNCNGVGGPDSCCPDMMYSNIQGTIESIQTKDRTGNKISPVLWNVGDTAKCPVDAWQAQVKMRHDGK